MSVELILVIGAVFLVLNAQPQKAPLLEAVKNGNRFDVVDSLNRGENVNQQDRNGKTALMYAAEIGHEDIVSLLLQRGANVNLKNNRGETALSLTKYNNIRQILQPLADADGDIVTPPQETGAYNDTNRLTRRRNIVDNDSEHQHNSGLENNTKPAENKHMRRLDL